MQKVKKGLLLSKADYEIITSVLRGGSEKTSFNRQEATQLEEELKSARLVNTEKMPPDVVRLYSHVKIKDQANGKVMNLTVVPPGKADIKQMKISVLSPIGTALIGYSKGETVRWNVPAGTKTFVILDVVNATEPVS